MKLSVATNFDPKLIEGIKNYPVDTIYGKLAVDFFGGGRSSYMLGKISKSKLESHVQHAKRSGIGFNYLLNASTLGNMETTRKGQKQLRKILDWLTEIEVSAITVSNPLLLRVIKESYPHFKVRISVFAGVDHVQKAKVWEELGADIICLDSLTVNRDIEALQTLSKAMSCELELLANGNCMASCALSPTHMNALAHSSQKSDPNGRFVIDHCVLECAKRKLQDPVNMIRSDWIRPEDLHLYEKLGYNNFKLVERNLPTSVMIKRVKAYSERSFSGNLIELVQPYGQTCSGDEKPHYNANGGSVPLLNFLRPFKINLRKLLRIKELTEKRGMLCSLSGEQPIYICNNKLDGFLEMVWQKKCRYNDCSKCQYCDQVAKDVVTINQSFRSECLSLHKKIDEDIDTGMLWL